MPDHRRDDPTRNATRSRRPAWQDVLGSATSTLSGPSHPPGPATAAEAEGVPTRLLHRRASAEALASERPFNPLKPAEYGPDAGRRPPAGTHAGPDDQEATASTVHEDRRSAKLGGGQPPVGRNAVNGSLDRVRVDSHWRSLSSNHGMLVADNQSSLKAGLRGPTLLEDFVLREKLTHFDHERIPERVVYARGCGAHGHFECYEALDALTRADLFSLAGKRTPVFVRFSCATGERGSADAVRDTRGFAVKFYTDEGNWDLVGSSVPVFFVQDAIKFPDLMHALKPEPHHQMPQASSAHDTFWDFVSLMPESMHHVLWVMSDRGVPRSYRTMQGFGVHTFRFVNHAGTSVFVKFHWLPLAGTQSLVWDEALKIAGADPDHHRRDLWEAIEAGAFPAWELAVQTFTEAEAQAFSFDVLDATKLVPEELVPLRRIGRLVLDRNPDNFFAETEQVAFCPAHVVPGIDFSNDPLLQGRMHSYLDTQLWRLGGPNFHEIPVNASLAPVHNNQRDGRQRQAVHRGRVAYEPNSLGGGCPFQAGPRGFVPVPERMHEDKLRGKPERFADHWTQPRLFWRSQTPVERRHLVAALRFELARVTVAALRERVLSLLVQIDLELAGAVADGLGLALPPAAGGAERPPDVRPEVQHSAALSLSCRPGPGDVRLRRVALLAAPGVDADGLRRVQQTLLQAGATPRIVAVRLGRIAAGDGAALEAEASAEAMPSVLWDAAVVPAGEAGARALAADGALRAFVRDQYRHGKPLLALGAGRQLLDAAGVPPTLPDGRPDPGLLYAEQASEPALRQFVQALAAHRHFERETDPPRV